MDSLKARIRQALAPSSCAEIARRTGFNKETVRRYCCCDNGIPSLAFIMKLCAEWDLNANWVMFGQEPRHGRDLQSQVTAALAPQHTTEVFACLMTRIGGDGPGPSAGAGNGELSPPTAALPIVVVKPPAWSSPQDGDGESVTGPNGVCVVGRNGGQPTGARTGRW